VAEYPVVRKDSGEGEKSKTSRQSADTTAAPSQWEGGWNCSNRESSPQSCQKGDQRRRNSATMVVQIRRKVLREDQGCGRKMGGDASPYASLSDTTERDVM